MRLNAYSMFVAILVLWSSVKADGDASVAKQATPLAIGTIDVIYIFKNFEPVKEKLSQLQAESGRFEQNYKSWILERAKIEQSLKTASDSTESRADLEQQLARLKAQKSYKPDDINRERASAENRLAAIEVETYKAIQGEVRKIAQQRGLKLVIVRRQVPLESERLRGLTRLLDQRIIFEEGLDITNDVLSALEAAHQAKPTTNDEQK